MAQPGNDRPDLVPAHEFRDRGESYRLVTARRAGTITVLYVTSDGWAYRDESGNLTGVTVEIMRDFARWIEVREGVTLDLKWEEEEEWARFYRRVRDGQSGLFGIGNTTITDARREEIDFSPPYLNNVAVLITHEDVPDLPSLDRAPEHFAGFTAYAFRGTLHEDRVEGLRAQRIPDFNVRYMDSNNEIVDAVAQGPGRLAWIDVYNFWRAQGSGIPIRRHPAGDDASETLGIILPRGSDWTPLLEAFFREGEGYRNGTRYRELLRTHLGEGLTWLLEEARRVQEDGLGALGEPELLRPD